MTDKAAFIVDRKGYRLTDTGGIVVYAVDVGTADKAGEGDWDRAARLQRERTQCVDCGATIADGGIYCLEDAPYGFWHWLRYFSPIRWKRPGMAQDGRGDR